MTTLLAILKNLSVSRRPSEQDSDIDVKRFVKDPSTSVMTEDPSIVEYFSENEPHRCGYCGSQDTNYSHG